LSITLKNKVLLMMKNSKVTYSIQPILITRDTPFGMFTFCLNHSLSFLLFEAQKGLRPKLVLDLLNLNSVIFIYPAVWAYKRSILLGLGKYPKKVLIPPKYGPQLLALEARQNQYHLSK
jgi:hypothetical protein